MTIRLSRRRLLSTGAGALGTVAMPDLSRAAVALWSTALDPTPV